MENIIEKKAKEKALEIDIDTSKQMRSQDNRFT